jgi:hypothetical protein
MFELLETSLRNLDTPTPDPVWEDIAKSCCSYISGGASGDLWPKEGRVCCICLRDLVGVDPLSSCSTCFRLLCANCAESEPHPANHKHEISASSWPADLTADMLLQKGYLKKLLTWLESHQKLSNQST